MYRRSSRKIVVSWQTRDYYRTRRARVRLVSEKSPIRALYRSRLILTFASDRRIFTRRSPVSARVKISVEKKKKTHIDYVNVYTSTIRTWYCVRIEHREEGKCCTRFSYRHNTGTPCVLDKAKDTINISLRRRVYAKLCISSLRFWILEIPLCLRADGRSRNTQCNVPFNNNYNCKSRYTIRERCYWRE